VRADEKAALAVAAGRGFSDVVCMVEGVHRAVLARAYGFVGAAGRAPRGAQEIFTTGIYASVRGIGTLLAYGSSQVLAAGANPQAEATREDRAGAQLLAALCSAFGDHLKDANSTLAIPMSVRHGGAPLAPTSAALTQAFPHATSGIALFIHGLGMTEHAWNPARAKSRDGTGGRGERGFAKRLATDLGLTPVYVRYNTGLHISTNGDLLADLLDLVVRHWPTPVTRVVLVGHSMGGLVARSACHSGHSTGAAWVPLVSDLVTLGSPHHGAPLEQVANIAAGVLRLAPESRPLADLLDRRSAGIKDLRFGYVTDQAWLHGSPNAIRDESGDVPLLPTSRHHFLAGTVCRRADSWMADLIGDYMVLPASATRRKSTVHQPYPPDAGHRVAGVNHRALLVSSDVHRMLRNRLSEPSTVRRGSQSGQRP